MRAVVAYITCYILFSSCAIYESREVDLGSHLIYALQVMLLINAVQIKLFYFSDFLDMVNVVPRIMQVQF